MTKALPQSTNVAWSKDGEKKEMVLMQQWEKGFSGCWTEFTVQRA